MLPATFIVPFFTSINFCSLLSITDITTVVKKSGNVSGDQNGSSYGTTDLNDFNFKQTTTTETTGPIDLKQFGLEATANTNQASGNEDYSHYFKETKTTTTTQNAGPADLKQFGIDINSGAASGDFDLKSLGLDNAQQKTTTTTTTIKTTGNVDLNNLGLDTATSAAGGFDLKALGLDNATTQKTTTTTTTTKTTGVPNASATEFKADFAFPDASANAFGTTQSSSTSEVNTYGTTKTTTTKVQKSYVGPTQSYSYNYSYNIPATTTTVTKSANIVSSDGNNF